MNTGDGTGQSTGPRGEKKPVISIVTVCLNAADTIRDTMESVAAQDYPHIEHIVIDGGSKDGTLEALRPYEPRIARMVSEKDHGLYDAMNKGAAMASGEVIGFLNADDFYASPRTLSIVMEQFSEEAVGACYGDLEYVARDDTQNIVRRWITGDFRKGSFISGWAPPHPAFFVRRRLFAENAGFNLNFRFAADADLMMRLLEVEGIECSYVNEVLVKMRTGGATNASLGNVIRGNLEIWHALKSNGLRPKLVPFFVRKAAFKAKHFAKAAGSHRLA